MAEVFLTGKRGPLQVSLDLNLASDRGQHHPQDLLYRHTFSTLHHRMSKITLEKALNMHLLHFAISTSSFLRLCPSSPSFCSDPLNRPSGLVPQRSFLRYPLSLQNSWEPMSPPSLTC